jgi:hypothetical protein
MTLGHLETPSQAAAGSVEKRSCTRAQRASQTKHATRSRFFGVPIDGPATLTDDL